ncbi:tetratricopeptide repeat protein [bacterium]|nr:tetratricopeptide repeat protein [bacterium]
MILRRETTSSINLPALSLLLALLFQGCGGNLLDQPDPRQRWEESCNRAYVLQSRKQFKKAATVYEEALANLSASGSMRGERARTLLALSEVYFESGDLNKASSSLQESLKIFRTLWKPDKGGDLNREIALNLVKGMVLQSEIAIREKRLEDAYDTINSAFDTGKSILAPDHTMHRILITKAAILEEQGDKKQADLIKQEALVLASPMHYKDNPALKKKSPEELYLAARESLEGMNLPEAKVYLDSYLPDLEKQEPHSALLGRSYFVKGRLALMDDQFDEAERCYKKAIEILSKKEGKENNQCRIESYFSLASLKLNIREYEECIKICREAIAISKQTETTKREFKTESKFLELLVKALVRSKKLEEAETAIKERMALEKQIKGKDNKRYAKAITELARLYAAKGDLKSARGAYEEAIREREIETKVNPVFLQDLHKEYALYLKKNGLDKEAKEHFEKEKKLRSAISGSS